MLSRDLGQNHIHNNTKMLFFLFTVILRSVDYTRLNSEAELRIQLSLFRQTLKRITKRYNNITLLIFFIFENVVIYLYKHVIYVNM